MHDAKTGGCKKDSAKSSLEHKLEHDGFSKSQASYIYYYTMRNSQTNAGQMLADAVVALEQNPSMKNTLTSAVQTMMDTASTASASGTAGNNASIKQDQASQNINAIVAQRASAWTPMPS